MIVRCRLIGIALLVGAVVLGPSVLAQDKGKPEKRGTVCPLYKAAAFEDYCTYYAFECPSKPVAYNDQDCNLPSGNCMTGANCFGAHRALRRGAGAHSSEDVIRDGLSRPYPAAVNPNLEEGVSIADRSKVQFRDNANTLIKAKLFLIKAARPQQPTAYFGLGVEIISGADFPEITSDNLEFDGKICYLTIGDITYTVVLHTTPRTVGKENPMVRPRAQPKALPNGLPPKALPKGPPQVQAGPPASSSLETALLVRGRVFSAVARSRFAR